MLIDGAVICTASGRYVEPLDLQPEDIYIGDVAHALSNQCRYSGHTSSFYSVAEHSVRVAAYLEAAGYTPAAALWGLLHDATEAYLIYLPRPLKDHGEMGRLYRVAEDRAMVAVARHFDLVGDKMPPEVKMADLVLLATERRDLMPPEGEWEILAGVETIEETIVPWSPDQAQRAYLAMYERLIAKPFKQGRYGPCLGELCPGAEDGCKLLGRCTVNESDAEVRDCFERDAIPGWFVCHGSLTVEMAQAEYERMFRGLNDEVTEVFDEATAAVVDEVRVYLNGEVRATSSTGAQKGRKPSAFSLLPGAALDKVAAHYAKGALKYAAHNWRGGYPWSWSLDALLRHAHAYADGETFDEETGSSHMAAVAFHALALLTFEDEHPEQDDRWKGGASEAA